MPKYEIVETKTGKVINTIIGEWDTIKNSVSKLNSEGKGVFARKIGEVHKNVIDLMDKPFDASEDDGYLVFCTDAWTSGNPGKGGCKMTDIHGEVIISRDSEGVHTNNFFELYGVYMALKYITEEKKISGKVRVYTDSQTVLSWLDSGTHNASRDQQEVSNMIYLTRVMLRGYSNITVVKWDTTRRGEIPADYNRK